MWSFPSSGYYNCKARAALQAAPVLAAIAATCILAKVQPVVDVSAWARQFAVNAKGGCDMIQWILQIIMEAEPNLARATLDAINAFGDLKRSGLASELC